MSLYDLRYLCSTMTDIDMTIHQKNALHIKNMVCSHCIINDIPNYNITSLQLLCRTSVFY